MAITYPPEMLPPPDEDDEVEIVIDGIIYSPDGASYMLAGLEGIEFPVFQASDSERSPCPNPLSS